MIRIYQGHVTESEGMSTLSTEIDIDGDKKDVLISVESEYGKYLSPERADYALVGMLPYAFRNRHDIICEAPVTDELLYNIQEVLMPTFIYSDPRVYSTKIQAEIAPALDKLPVENAFNGGVGTGISCGVDSFYSTLKHLNSKYPSRKLTHLCIFNNGSLHHYSRKNLELNAQKVFERAEVVATKLNLPLIKLDSNFRTVLEQGHLLTHTYLDALAIYAMQKLWRVYYYSSSHSFWEFSLQNNMDVAPGRFEPFLLDCFSTSALKIISSGSEVSRNEKTEFIADNPIVQKYLHVCTRRISRNCGQCTKCMRTLLALDALNKLDNFRGSLFDIDDYLKNREHTAYIHLLKAINKNPASSYLAESYNILYERHKEFFDTLKSKGTPNLTK